MSPAAGAIRLALLAGLLAGSVVAAPVSLVAAEAPTGPLDLSSMAAPGLGAQPTRTSARIAPLPRLRGGPAVVDGAEPACRAALARLGVTWVAAPPISSGRCGIAAPHAISAAAHGAISFSQPATLSCAAAATLASWLLEHVQPAARTHLQRDITGIRVAASYVCRTRNSQANAKLSEHARGHAIDISAFEVAGRGWIEIGRAAANQQSFLSAIRRTACGPFKTVLGPGSDAYHSDHFHLDIARRSNGSTYCK